MQNLEERIRLRRELYEEYIKSERLLEEEMNWLKDIIPYEKAEVFVGTRMITIDYQTKDLEEIELKIVPTISEYLSARIGYPYRSWSKDVSSIQVTYRAHWRPPAENNYTGISIALVVAFVPEASCRIRQVATGRMVKRIETVELELPEIIYEIDCAEEN